METWTELKVYLNDNTENVAQITDYFSFIWTDRYNEVGDFELQLPYTEENATKYQLGYLITCNLSSGVMIIENITVSISFDGGRILIVKGRSIESILSRRIVAETFVRTPDDYDSNKLITCLNDICKLCFSSTVNIMSEKNSFASYGYIEVEGRDDLGLYHDADGNYVFIAPNGDSLGHISRSEASIEATGKDLLSILQEQCQLFGFGFRLRYIVDPNNDEGYFKIEIYDGYDKSETIQYSEENRNLSSIEYDTDSTDYKNYIFVQGDEVNESSGEAEVSTVEYKQETNSKKTRLRMNKEYKAKEDINVYTTLVKTNPNQESEIKYILKSGDIVIFSSVSTNRAYVSKVNGKSKLKIESGNEITVGGIIDLGPNGTLINSYFEEVGDYSTSQYVYFNPSEDSSNETSPSYYRTGISLKDSNGNIFSGLDRREAYIDSSIAKGLNINEKYAKRLRKEGLLELTRQYGIKTQISCQIMHDTLYAYGINFNVGDVIGIKFNPIIVPGDIGSSSSISLFKMRVKEYTISHSTSGLDLYPTLDLYDPNYWESANNGILYSDKEAEFGDDLKRVKVNFYYGTNDEIDHGGVKGPDSNELQSLFDQQGDIVWEPIFKDYIDPNVTQQIDWQNDTIGIYTIIETGDWIPVPGVKPIKLGADLYSFNGWYLDNSDGPLISVSEAESRISGEINDDALWEKGARYIGMTPIEPETNKDDPVNLLECSFYGQYLGSSFLIYFEKGEHGTWKYHPYQNDISIEAHYGESGDSLHEKLSDRSYTIDSEDGWEFFEWEDTVTGERGRIPHEVRGPDRYVAIYKDKTEYVKITFKTGPQGKFTDEEHAKDSSYTISVKKGSTISAPGVESIRPELYYRDENNPWVPVFNETANENKTYTANWKRADSRDPQHRDRQTIYQDPEEPNPTPSTGPGQSWTGDQVVINDNQTKVDNKSITEVDTFEMHHFKSYASTKGDVYANIGDLDKAEIWVEIFCTDTGGVTPSKRHDDPKYPGKWVYRTPYYFAEFPRIVKDGPDQFFEIEKEYDIGSTKLVARFINPPSSVGRAYEFIGKSDDYKQSWGNHVLNDSETFSPIFTMSMYRKSDDACIGIWWWRFGRGAQVAEVAFSTTPVFIPYREFQKLDGYNGSTYEFYEGSYYIKHNGLYYRIWSRPSWWGTNDGQRNIYARKRTGWYVGFTAQAYDDNGNLINEEWKRNARGIATSISNYVVGISDNQNGPWEIVTSEPKVKQTWTRQLSYIYGKYYDEHDDIQQAENSIKSPYSKINSARFINHTFSGHSYTANSTVDLGDVYTDTGLQFSIILDSAYGEEAIYMSKYYRLANAINGGSPSNGFGPDKPGPDELAGQGYGELYPTLYYNEVGGSEGYASLGSGYLFGSKFNEPVSNRPSFSTYGDFYIREDTSYPNVDINTIFGKWSIVNDGDGNAKSRRYIGKAYVKNDLGNTVLVDKTEEDSEIGWLIGHEESGKSNDTILKISGSENFFGTFLSQIYDAYAEEYGDVVYFSVYDQMANMYSELGFASQVGFQWQVYDSNIENYRDIEKSELYIGPIFDMRKTSISDWDIGIAEGDTETVKKNKINEFFGAIFGETTEWYSGIKDEFNSFFNNGNSIFKEVSGPFAAVKDYIYDIREAIETPILEAIIELLPDISKMPSLRVHVTEQNVNNYYRCVLTMYDADGNVTETYTAGPVTVLLEP